MYRRPTAVALVVVVVLVAGCTGATDDPSSPDVPVGPSDPPTATPAPTPAGPVYDLPLSGEVVASAHNESLRTAGSYTAETDITIDGGSEAPVRLQATSAVDLERGTMLVHSSTAEPGSHEIYVGPDGSAYQRVETVSGDVTYERLADAPDVTGYFSLPIARLIEEATFTYAGRSRVAGTPVSVYEVTSLEALVAPASVPENEVDGIETFEVELAIANDGLIQRFGYRVEIEVDGTSRTIAISTVFRAVGTTTVEPPDWLDEAT